MTDLDTLGENLQEIPMVAGHVGRFGGRPARMPHLVVTRRLPL